LRADLPSEVREAAQQLAAADQLARTLHPSPSRESVERSTHVKSPSTSTKSEIKSETSEGWDYEQQLPPDYHDQDHHGQDQHRAKRERDPSPSVSDNSWGSWHDPHDRHGPHAPGTFQEGQWTSSSGYRNPYPQEQDVADPHPGWRQSANGCWRQRRQTGDERRGQPRPRDSRGQWNGEDR